LDNGRTVKEATRNEIKMINLSLLRGKVGHESSEDGLISLVFLFIICWWGWKEEKEMSVFNFQKYIYKLI